MSESHKNSIINWTGFIASIITIFLFIQSTDQYKIFSKEINEIKAVEKTKEESNSRNNDFIKKDKEELAKTIIHKPKNREETVNPNSFKKETESTEKIPTKADARVTFNVESINTIRTHKDSKYRLEWVTNQFPKMNWFDAKKLEKKINEKDKGDSWKLASTSELYSLAKKQKNQHNIGLINAFVNENIIPGVYWSNNTCEIRDSHMKCLESYTNSGSQSDTAFALAFIGISGTYKKRTKLRVLFVRKY